MGSTAVTLRIVAPHFVAGVDLVDGIVLSGAPILKYMVGWSRVRVETYCQTKRWTYEEV